MRHVKESGHQRLTDFKNDRKVMLAAQRCMMTTVMTAAFEIRRCLPPPAAMPHNHVDGGFLDQRWSGWSADGTAALPCLNLSS